MLFLLLQSPRNGEDLSDGEAEVEPVEMTAPRESSPSEDGLAGPGGQVRLKVNYAYRYLKIGFFQKM